MSEIPVLLQIIIIILVLPVILGIVGALISGLAYFILKLFFKDD